MLRNSKPKIYDLTQKQVDLLNELKFVVNGFGSYNDVSLKSKCFNKKYDMCGGQFELMIDLSDPYSQIKPYVKIGTPYNNWWCTTFSINDFTKEVDNFYRRLKNDLTILRKNEIIT